MHGRDMSSEMLHLFISMCVTDGITLSDGLSSEHISLKLLLLLKTTSQ